MTSTAVAPEILPPNVQAPDPEPERQAVNALVLRAQSFTITSNDEFVACGEFLKEIAGKKKQVEAKFQPAKDAAHKAWKSLCDLITEITSPLSLADSTCRAKLLEYTRKMEAERRRQEQEEREAAEAIAREEQERAAQQLLDTAAALEKQGDALGAQSVMAEAENVAAAPVVVAPVYVAPSTPKITGVSTRETWTIDEDNIDLMELCKGVVAGKVPILAIQANVKFLKQQARSMRDMLAYPGVKAIRESGLSVRSK